MPQTMKKGIVHGGDAGPGKNTRFQRSGLEFKAF